MYLAFLEENYWLSSLADVSFLEQVSIESLNNFEALETPFTIRYGCQPFEVFPRPFPSY